MIKKLKILFTKFEKALAMQILEQEGSFCNSYHVQMGVPDLCVNDIYLCAEDERDNLNHVSVIEFVSNKLRDAYLKDVIRWISKEQFAMRLGKLKFGELCEAHVGDRWEKRKLLSILPKRYKNRFIVEGVEDDESWVGCSEIRYLPDWNKSTVEECGQLITYTWEG